MSPRRLLRGLAVPAALTGLLVLAACAGGGRSRADDGELRDRVTASDQTDADRRAKVRLELAAAYFGRGQLETALDEVKLALQANPELGAAYSLRGLIYGALGEARLAEDSFRRALSLNGRDGDSLHNYGWFLCQNQRFDEAVERFNQTLALPQYREQARTLMARGVCQGRAGRWLEAEGSLMRAYELEPANPAIGVGLSEVLYRRGDYERARFYIGRVNSASSSTNAQTLWLALRIERKLGDAAAQRRLGEQLSARFPQSPEALLYERGSFDD